MSRIIMKVLKVTPEGCNEIENADSGAHWICEIISPLILNRLSVGSDPTAKIWEIIKPFSKRISSQLMISAG